MIKESTFWVGLRRTLWAAAAGSLVGAGVLAWVGPAGMWLVLPALAVAAIVAGVMAKRA